MGEQDFIFFIFNIVLKYNCIFIVLLYFNLLFFIKKLKKVKGRYATGRLWFILRGLYLVPSRNGAFENMVFRPLNI
jgi:hypothetical protein